MLSEEKLDRAYVWAERSAKALGWLIGTAFALGIWVATIQFQVASNGAAITEIKARQRTDDQERAELRETLAEIRSDVRWLRDSIGRNR